jgi:hypothetical protein
MENNNQPTSPFENMIIAATSVDSGARKGAI